MLKESSVPERSRRRPGLDRTGCRAYPSRTGDTPDGDELDRRLVVVEERTDTMQADLSAALDRFRTDMAAREIRLILARSP